MSLFSRWADYRKWAPDARPLEKLAFIEGYKAAELDLTKNGGRV